MDVVYRLGAASAADVHRRLPEAPSYSTVRKMLTLLEGKGHVKHRLDGPRYIYEPTMQQESARRSALRHLVDTFFNGSERDLVATLVREQNVSDQSLAELTRLIQAARARAREGSK